MRHFWRRLLARCGVRDRYEVTAGAGGRWRSSRYDGDAHCAPFKYRWAPMTMGDRYTLARIEDSVALDGVDEAHALAQQLEPALLASRLQLRDDDGAWQQATAADVAELGGMSDDAYKHLRGNILAAYYREMIEGDRAGKALRRCASSRSALRSLLARAESV